MDMQLQSALINNFHLDQNEISQLTSYFILHWESDYVYSKISSSGIISNQGVDYIVIMPAKTRTTLFYPVRQLRLSFRLPKPGLGLYPTVVIREF